MSFDSNSIGNLFSSLNTNTTGSSNTYGSLGINLADYASIKNGSYSKLMKSYYAMDEAEDVKKSNSKNDTDDSDATIKNIKNTAKELKESASELYSGKALFEKSYEV